VASPALLLAGVIALHMLAVMSPGPAFVMVTRAAVGQSRAAGIATGLGVAAAALTWALGASLGMNLVLARLPWLFRAIQLAGGVYLLWLGVQSWRHAAAPMAEAALPAGGRRSDLWRAWTTGLRGGLTNPKIMVFFGSIFVALFAPGTPLWVRVAAVAMVPVNETIWYSTLATLFAAGPVRRYYRRAKAWIERATGTLLGGFGLRLAAGALARVGS
jgi:RhtB (resistance to homoserine/threonine) family protein